MTLTTELDKLGTPSPPFDPFEALEHAVESIVETCDVQFEREFLRSGKEPNLDSAQCGSSISLAGESGGLILALLCDAPTSESLTRMLFAMEDDEECPPEDVADALNEIVNVAAGVFKKYRTEAGQPLNLGLPLYLEGGNSIKFSSSRATEQACELRDADGSTIQVHLIWQKGTGK